ncbi:sulfur carrier protein ThiS [Ramlibacter tataouinensis]|uniref:Candidate ThiS protein n=1 Tax=Ramlibacter tataouinensis (strain ATCC BAA-407 / DSM 14655 / LMG 21543 / TTB310) TaxID=365046 RepID=F5Y0G0_RAMTT|nr:sulfur carrier protein ThiS [Ramlibacter tataouinensis]AEG93366.1 Candidate ThiS protein [Ramlibacter tataouinensis TTB310]
MIAITLNHERVPLEDGATLASLIASLPEAPAALATAVNGDFVPRARRPEVVLRDGDAVMTFEPITGG